MTIKDQLEMFKEIAFNKDEWIIQIVFTHELQTVYGSEDLIDLYEVILVKLHNENIIYNRRKK